MKMSLKKVLLGSLLSSFIAAPVFAAGLGDKGVKLGMNMANLSGADAEATGTTNSNRIGVTLGGFGVWDINDKLGIRPEVLFTQKGVTTEVTALSTEVPTTLSYLEVPVMMQYQMPVSGINVNFFGGPYMGILLSADQDGTDIKDNTNTVDYGLQLGAGAIIQKQFTVDLSYSMGLASIDNSGADADIKNSGILISGGYLFK